MPPPTPAEAQKQLDTAVITAVKTQYTGPKEGRGIVICAGGDRYLVNAWVCIQMLRQHGCRLPIQVWHLGPGEMPRKWLRILEQQHVQTVDAKTIQPQPRILNGWEVKPFSIIHSPWREVLLLDADNVAVADPTYLFDTPEYKVTGAFFWPDFGRLSAKRAIWSLTRVPYRDEPEFETGQVLLDKSRCWSALQVTMHLNENSDFWYKHIHGDKETFHLAWRRLEQPYSMPKRGVHGSHGVMHQHDSQGKRIFQHRNMHKWKLNGNTVISDFLFEKECLSHINQLSHLLAQEAACMTDREKAATQQILQQRLYVYNRIHHDHRVMELLPDGKIGRGNGGCEQTWEVREQNDTAKLCISGKDGVICELQYEDTGIWRGKWLKHEKMPIALVPVVPDPLELDGLDMEYFNGKPFYFRPHTLDKDISNEVIRRDCYRLKKLSKTVNAKTIVDVGAHIGCFTNWAKQHWPNATILAYEPSPKNFLLLAQNTTFLPDVRCRMLAFSDRLCVTRIKEIVPNTGASQVGAEGVSVIGRDASAAIELEGLQDIDILKLDCEGGETTVITSLKESGVLKRVRIILGEWHGALHKQTIESLRQDYDVEMVPNNKLGYFWATRK